MKKYLIPGVVALAVALVPGTASAAVEPPSAANNTLLITASIPTPDPGFKFTVVFRCAPGAVTGTGANTVVTLTDTASPFDTTAITGATPPVGSTTVPNVCSNSITTALSNIDVTTTGSDGVDTVDPGGATVLSGLTQSAAVPASLFVTGYNINLLQEGENQVAANVRTKIEATNTVQGVQTTNTAGGVPPDGSVFITTTINDPNDIRGDGDETATPGSFTANYDDLAWTAGSTGAILYRQDSIVPETVPVDPVNPVPPDPKPKKKCKKGFKKKKIKGKVKCVKKKKGKKKK